MTLPHTISTISVGQEAVIKAYKNHELAAKLLSMGILPGTEIKLIRRAPFGGACYIKAKNHLLALRISEAAAVELELQVKNIKPSV